MIKEIKERDLKDRNRWSTSQSTEKPGKLVVVPKSKNTKINFKNRERMKDHASYEVPVENVKDDFRISVDKEVPAE